MKWCNVGFCTQHKYQRMRYGVAATRSRISLNISIWPDVNQQLPIKRSSAFLYLRTGKEQIKRFFAFHSLCFESQFAAMQKRSLLMKYEHKFEIFSQFLFFFSKNFRYVLLWEVYWVAFVGNNWSWNEFDGFSSGFDCWGRVCTSIESHYVSLEFRVV